MAIVDFLRSRFPNLGQGDVVKELSCKPEVKNVGKTYVRVEAKPSREICPGCSLSHICGASTTPVDCHSVRSNEYI
jgi:hypothetical protein